jgi:hypothetical protein
LEKKELLNILLLAVAVAVALVVAVAVQAVCLREPLL